MSDSPAAATASSVQQPGDAALAVAGVSKQYGQTRALDDVSIEFASGLVHGLVGHNGAGKSTLLRIIAGAEQPDAGRMELGGRAFAPVEPVDALAEGVACVYQELSLPENLSVADCLFLGQELRTRGVLRRREMRSQAATMCERMGLSLDPATRLADISVADRQLLEITAALHRRSRVLLLDEPTTALEPKQIDTLFGILRRAASTDGIAIVIVDHRLDEVYAVADRVVALTDGRLALAGPVQELSRQALVDAIVGERAHQAAGERRTGRTPSYALSLAGRSADATAPTQSAVPMLLVESLQGPRLRSVDLSVYPGEVVGIYGLNGSGRTRLLRTLYGDETATSGRIELAGTQYQPRSPRDAIRAGVAFVPEERKADGFIPLMDALRNATLPIIDRYLSNGMLPRSRMARDAEVALGQLGIRGDVRGPIALLSGGNQQKVLFGRSAMQRPRLLLLDEPTKGIDIGAKGEIHRLIRDMAREGDVAVVLVSSEEEEVLDVADVVMVMRDGRCDGRRHEVDGLTISDLRHLAFEVGHTGSEVGGGEDGARVAMSGER